MPKIRRRVSSKLLPMKNYRFSITFTILLALLNCDDDTPNPINGCTNRSSFNFNAAATQDDGSCKSMIGCTGYANGFANSGMIGNTFGNQYYDQKMNEEITIQSYFFNGVGATVFTLQEPSVYDRNAYATPDGKILFGVYMLYYIVQNYGELPIAGVLAHEWGHRVQYTYNWSLGNPAQELEADAFSGYYMALRKQWAWSQIQSYYANVYATGDYFFNSPTHHGTPNQRVTAAYLGVTTAINALQNNTHYSYSDLHSIFTNQIVNKILKGPRLQARPEVVYPQNLNDDYVRSLFPKK